MAVEVIDLTVSSPPPLVFDVDGHRVQDVPDTTPDEVQKEKKKKKGRSRKPKNKSQEEDQKPDDKWRHDKYSEEDKPRRREKRKREDGKDNARHRRRRRSLTPFIVDTAPSEIHGGALLSTLPKDSETLVTPSTESGSSMKSLLLPSHVTLSTAEPISSQGDTRSLSPVSEASGIDFLDDDRVVGAPRYFDDRATNPTASRLRGPCKNCGDDDHHFKNCTTMICLTCGARDEHTTRSCPIVRTCWNCKGKGHLSRDCPRIGNLDRDRLDRQNCERCGSWKHHGTNCPTIWRIYTYLTDAERCTVLADRELKRQLGFDEGGEGYIARDLWCYNCGEHGHLGDDCEKASPNIDKPDEYSAFGSFNQWTGPFADPSYVSPDVPRGPREWEQRDRFDDGYGFSAETNVGRKGRENAKAKAREAQRVLDADEDEPDWFSQNRANGKGMAPQTSNAQGKGGLPPKPLPPVIHLGSSSSRPPRNSVPLSGRTPVAPRSLRGGIDMDSGRGSGEARRDQSEARSRDSPRDYRDSRGKDARQDAEQWRGGYPDRDRYRDDRERGRDEWRDDRGSRWHGGYHR